VCPYPHLAGVVCPSPRCPASGSILEYAARPSSGLDVHDLRVVVADLVGELGVDVHHLVGELADALNDQDVVQDLGHAVEIVGVLLVAGSVVIRSVSVGLPLPSDVPVFSTDSAGLNW